MCVCVGGGGCHLRTHPPFDLSIINIPIADMPNTLVWGQTLIFVTNPSFLSSKFVLVRSDPHVWNSLYFALSGSGKGAMTCILDFDPWHPCYSCSPSPTPSPNTHTHTHKLLDVSLTLILMC